MLANDLDADWEWSTKPRWHSTPSSFPHPPWARRLLRFQFGAQSIVLWCAGAVYRPISYSKRNNPKQESTFSFSFPHNYSPSSIPAHMNWIQFRTRSSWLNCALRDDEAVCWVSIGHYEALAVGNWWYWVSRGHSCLYILHKVEIWKGVTHTWQTDWLTDNFER